MACMQTTVSYSGNLFKSIETCQAHLSHSVQLMSKCLKIGGFDTHLCVEN